MKPMSRMFYLIPLASLFVSSFAGLVPVSVNAAPGDGATSNIRLLDTDANGYINRATFDIANPNGEAWQLVGASPYGLSFTDDGNDVTISSVSLTTAATANPVTVQVDLDTGDSDLTVGTAVDAYELVYTQETGDQTCSTACINDSTDEELNTIATGDSGATDTEIDAAVPVLYYIRYIDNSVGKISQILLGFSETIVAASVIAPQDLLFTNVGDFTGMAFGSSTTDVVTGSSSQWTVPVGTLQSVLDTHDDSGNIAISTQNNFSIEDTVGNVNNTLGALNLAFVTDAAAPGVKSITYQDGDSDGKIDRFLFTFTETVVAASVLSANDLDFENVGDFTGAAFGNDSTDVITASTTTATVVLGTEATVVDLDEGSGLLSLETVNAFSLSDGTNTNTLLDSLAYAPIIDGADFSGSSQFRQLLLQQEQQMQQEQQESAQQGGGNDEMIDEEETADQPVEEEQEEKAFGLDKNERPLKLGSLIKVAGNSAVYYLDANGVRHIFTSIHVYRSWYGDDFSAVVEISAETMASLPLGRPVTFRPGTMIKIRTLPSVYLIVGNREIRHIANESVAKSLFGDNWNKMIFDVEDAFFVNYKELSEQVAQFEDVDLDDLRKADRRANDEVVS